MRYRALRAHRQEAAAAFQCDAVEEVLRAGGCPDAAAGFRWRRPSGSAVGDVPVEGSAARGLGGQAQAQFVLQLVRAGRRSSRFCNAAFSTTTIPGPVSPAFCGGEYGDGGLKKAETGMVNKRLRVWPCACVVRRHARDRSLSGSIRGASKLRRGIARRRKTQRFQRLAPRGPEIAASERKTGAAPLQVELVCQR